MKWDEWRGDFDGNPVLWIKRVIKIPLFMTNAFGPLNIRVDLHKMVAADAAKSYHTHPAWAFRLVLWGGYNEEVPGAGIVAWIPGSFGLVAPAFCHRIHSFVSAECVSYSLWIRGPVIADVALVGSGWPPEKLGVHRGRN